MTNFIMQPTPSPWDVVIGPSPLGIVQVPSYCCLLISVQLFLRIMCYYISVNVTCSFIMEVIIMTVLKLLVATLLLVAATGAFGWWFCRLLSAVRSSSALGATIGGAIGSVLGFFFD